MQRYSILVVEDGETSRCLLSAMLERSGFTVLGAKNATEGLSALAGFRPDLVLLDVMLPDMDGFEFCGRAKANPLTCEIPIIFLTQFDDLPNKLRGLSSGAVDYITKPYIEEEILARILVQLKLRRANQRFFELQRRRLEELRGAQESFLTDLDSMPAARCKVYFEASEEAGGDQYDVGPLSDSTFGYCVSDIAGHGIETSFVSSVFKALFRENATLLDTPVETFQKINVLMADYLSDGQHITASYLTVNRAKGCATLVSAGHLPVLMTSPSGEVRELRAEGDVLGAFIAPIFTPLTLSVEKGSRFWLFTDGVVEDFRERRSWKAGLERLKALLPSLASLSLDEALGEIGSTLFSRHPGEDDRVLLACEV